jgi:hypothetical protein
MLVVLMVIGGCTTPTTTVSVVTVAASSQADLPSSIVATALTAVTKDIPSFELGSDGADDAPNIWSGPTLSLHELRWKLFFFRTLACHATLRAAVASLVLQLPAELGGLRCGPNSDLGEASSSEGMESHGEMGCDGGNDVGNAESIFRGSGL